MNLLLKILLDEQGGTLSITRKTANTLATASGMNLNYDEIEAVVNGGIEAGNIAADAVTAAKINSDVVRTNYGLVQHTDGSLYVDLSDTTPGLELTDGGLRVKAYGLAQRTSNGLDIGRSGDLLLSSASSVPTGWTDVSATYEGKFIRVSATALSSGGSDTHTHGAGSFATNTGTATASVDYGSSSYGDTLGGGPSKSDHTHPMPSVAVAGTSASGDNVPAYVSSKLFRHD